VAPAQFIFTTNNGAVTITHCIGPGDDVTNPDMVNGLPVTTIGQVASPAMRRLCLSAARRRQVFAGAVASARRPYLSEARRPYHGK
jgi:hypothetical protein